MNWGRFPRDIDLHAMQGNFHSYFGNKKSGTLSLRNDNTRGGQYVKHLYCKFNSKIGC